MTSNIDFRPDTILRQSGDYAGLTSESLDGTAVSGIKLHHWIWGRMIVLADAVTAGTEPQKHH